MKLQGVLHFEIWLPYSDVLFALLYKYVSDMWNAFRIVAARPCRNVGIQVIRILVHFLNTEYCENCYCLLFYTCQSGTPVRQRLHKSNLTSG